MIALSTQDVFLFSDTIDGNIAYSNPDMPFEDVKQFAECAQAADFIEKLSEGYDTIIGELRCRSFGRSAAQRIAACTCRCQKFIYNNFGRYHLGC